MADKTPRRRPGGQHRHKAVLLRTVRQHAGVPYEFEQRVCANCQRILGERQVRRTAS